MRLHHQSNTESILLETACSRRRRGLLAAFSACTDDDACLFVDFIVTLVAILSLPAGPFYYGVIHHLTVVCDNNSQTTASTTESLACRETVSLGG